jgi:lipopolysaccharide transport system permease protein
MSYYGVGWSINLFLVPVLIMTLLLIAVGLGTFFSAITVAYRDFRYVIPFLLQLWLFVTPVVYPASLVPSEWQWVLYLNPMSGIIEGFRATFLGAPLNVTALTISLLIAVAVLLIGIAYFEKVERRFADLI